MRLEEQKQIDSVLRDDWMMPRMVWLQHLETLFTYLEQFTASNKHKYLEKENFMEGLEKVK